MKAVFDEQQLRKGLAALHPDGEIFEIRMISGDGKTNYSGYFRDGDTLMGELKKIDLRGFNIYTTINEVNPACYDRAQRDHFVKNAKNTTSDGDIRRIRYLFIDLDPKRPAGVSSSDEELQHAKDLGNKVFVFMRDMGFYAPLTAYSGNGIHLLYRIDLTNSEHERKLVQNCLNTLAVLFSNETVDIDVKTCNPSRICKLYGTVAQKGNDSKDRPHRMSCVVGTVLPLEITDSAYLYKLTELLPKEPEKPQRYNNFSPRDFDLPDWMDKHGLRYREFDYSGGKKYVLDCCPFDPSHKGKDAAVFQMSSGAIGFHCFHNSCAGKTWRDLRIKLDPEAYEKRDQWLEARMYRNYNRNVPPAQHIEEKQGSPVFYTADDVFSMPEAEESFVRTGTTIIDRKMRGLRKGAVSLVSGLRSSAKSTLLSQWALNAVNDGFNVGFFSGELSPRKFFQWINQQAAGKGRVEASEKWEGYYTVPRTTQQRISGWLGKRFFLYNNEYGNDFSAILEQFSQKIESDKLDLLILDNLMAFNISSLSESKWEAQTAFVWKLHDLAQRTNTHIVFVAHPRKAMGFLRLDDISGSADLANAADNAFIVHRVNNDFRRLSAQMFGWKDSEEVYDASNCVEIAKDRDGGTQDVFVPLWYEKETKRLKNDLSENIVYGWDGGQQDTLDWTEMPETLDFEDVGKPEIVFD